LKLKNQSEKLQFKVLKLHNLKIIYSRKKLILTLDHFKFLSVILIFDFYILNFYV